MARQRADQGRAWPTQVRLMGLDWFERFPAAPHPYGLPSDSGAVPAWLPAQVSLRDYWARKMGLDPKELDGLKLEMPAQLPATVRVGRRDATTCRNNPILRVEEVPLEEYVQGVLTPEIGVFKSAASGRESSREVFKAFAVAARTYALYFVIGGFNDDEGYDLDDTACNQRYTDDRDPWIEALVRETAGQVLIREGTEGTFDKFEYAASCGRHESWPKYNAEGDYVSDAGLGEVCVGNWCGHNNCAAHQDNPNLPGDDRCLVRGVCQWGGLERSAQGQDYLAILQHYQPNLVIRGMDAPAPTTGTVKGFVREGDTLDTAAPVPGATVALDTGALTTVGADAYFEFVEVEPGSRRLSVSATSYARLERSFQLAAGQESWQSVLVTRLPDNPNNSGNNASNNAGNNGGNNADPNNSGNNVGNNADPNNSGANNSGANNVGNNNVGNNSADNNADDNADDNSGNNSGANNSDDDNSGGNNAGVNNSDGDNSGANNNADAGIGEPDRFGVFGEVPEGGLADSGCGCEVARPSRGFPWLWVGGLLGGVVFGVWRARRAR
jgi:hypothetical protein